MNKTLSSPGTATSTFCSNCSNNSINSENRNEKLVTWLLNYQVKNPHYTIKTCSRKNFLVKNFLSAKITSSNSAIWSCSHVGKWWIPCPDQSSLTTQCQYPTLEFTEIQKPTNSFFLGSQAGRGRKLYK